MKEGLTMDQINVDSLARLSKVCYRSGILPVFLGILVGFVGVINKDSQTIVVGLFVFIVGYALIKISSHIRRNIRQ